MGDLMDIVNSNDNSCYYYLNNPLDDVRDAGRRTLKAFGVKNRFVHFEFSDFPATSISARRARLSRSKSICVPAAEFRPT